MFRKILIAFLMGPISCGFVNCTFVHEGEQAKQEEWNPVSAGPVTTTV